MLTFTFPQLSPSFGHLLSLTFSAIYVGSIYVSSKSRLVFTTPPPSRSPTPNGNAHHANGSCSENSYASRSSTSTNGGPREKMKNERWRDDPDVIKARLVAVSIASLVCCSGVYFLLRSLAPSPAPTIWDLLSRLGFIPGQGSLTEMRVWDVLKPHLITPVLFLGPLYAIWLSGVMPGQRYWSWEMHIRRGLWTWQGIRNVLVAPPTEEIVFRGCTLAVLHLAGVSKYQLIFLSPLSFGLAHVHHAWDTFNRYGRTSQAAMRAFMVTLFQLTYTTLFGCYTSFLFLRTSSIYPPITAHMFCNFMGFPRMGYEMQMFPRRKASIVIAYILGVAGFIYVLPNWTRTKDSFYWINYVKGSNGGVY